MKFVGNLFESWFKSNIFHSKCKTNIEMTMTRIEMIKKRRKAMQKFLRNDIVDLLKSGFNSDAYRRAETLYFEQQRLLCYESVEQFCTLISDHLTAMNDQSECPEECKEVVSSLMYAAARLPGLPELRELRDLFSDKYGNSLDSFINEKFVKLLKPDHPTKDMKIQMLKEIASEYGIEWDPEPSKRKSYKPPLSEHDSSQNTYRDQENDTKRNVHKNGRRINVQETRKEDGDDRNQTEKKNENGDIKKQVDLMRERLMNYLSRTTSIFSSSRETSTGTSPEESSSDDSTNQKPFFPFRIMPPPYVKPDRSRENPEVFNHPNIEIRDGEAAAPPNVNSRRRRKGGALPRAKSHSTECLPNPVPTEALPRGHIRMASYPSDSTVRPPMGHVHPKLPDYDDIKAFFASLRAKS